MVVRFALPHEAENYGKLETELYDTAAKLPMTDENTIRAWTQDKMPESFRKTISDNPFFAIDSPAGDNPVATGFLDLENQSVEAIFTLPEFTGQGMAKVILEAVKTEAKRRGIKTLFLSSTPNAFEFYEKNGFTLIKESFHYSRMANVKLRCMDMSCDL